MPSWGVGIVWGKDTAPMAFKTLAGPCITRHISNFSNSYAHSKHSCKRSAGRVRGACA